MPDKLDQFFTKPEVAVECWSALVPVLRKLTGKEIDDLFFIEPSAGDGVFYDLLPEGAGHRIGVDIDPQRCDLVRQDFLTWDVSPSVHAVENTVVVGNPPFGKRGDMAVRFVNRAAVFADTVAFIVPAIFRKYFIHRQLTDGLRWIHSTPLRRDAFRTIGGDYLANTEFQIWTRLQSNDTDSRLFSAPPINHDDFHMWQYNNTKAALKMFNNDFDFAVPCQGWQDYSRRETEAEACEKQKQWILFSARNSTAERRLRGLDFESLAMSCATIIPGFRKGDVVAEYVNMYG